ncbi:MAG: ribonuclease-3 [Oceanicoccus sp.]|jgi:ribonuclease-3
MTKIKTNLSELQAQIGLDFEKVELLELAFVHKSFINENTASSACNERLEFLGDAVLELVVTEFLYLTYPETDEGELTNWRSALVKGKNLAQVARKLGLGTYLELSRGEDMSGGRDKDYILANTMEALLGALYLDKGYEVAKVFIHKNIIEFLDEILSQGLHIDAKSHVQELTQEKLGVTPHYELIDESGPDHAKTFLMGVYFGEDLVGQGKGASKQIAEQEAARDALKKKGWV